MIKASSLTSRLDLPVLLNSRRLLATAVEVGTHQGAFAALFLQTWLGKTFYCIDPWRSVAGYEEQEKHLYQRGASRQHDLAIAKKVVQAQLRHYQDVFFLETTSQDAAPYFQDSSLDFVYLDADHRYRCLFDDLCTWWSKVRPGGILAGHDVVYFDGMLDQTDHWQTDVQAAIVSFQKRLASKCPDCSIIVEQRDRLDGRLVPWSYYFEKP